MRALQKCKWTLCTLLLCGKAKTGSSKAARKRFWKGIGYNWVKRSLILRFWNYNRRENPHNVAKNKRMMSSWRCEHLVDAFSFIVITGTFIILMIFSRHFFLDLHKGEMLFTILLFGWQGKQITFRESLLTRKQLTENGV